MLITTRRCPATSLLSCDFSNQERSAAATLRTPAAAASERSRRTTPRRPRTAAARRRALSGPVDDSELVDGGRVLAAPAAGRPGGGPLAGPAVGRQPIPLAAVELVGRLDLAAVGTALDGGHAAVPSGAKAASSSPSNTSRGWRLRSGTGHLRRVWMAVTPGLSFGWAMVMTQAATAVPTPRPPSGRPSELA
jgi:hypothetical protein